MVIASIPSSQGSSPIPKLQTQWSAHIAVDTIERHYLSRTEIKEVDHGGEQSRRTHARGQTDAARFSVQMGDTQFQSGRILRSTPTTTPRRRRCRLGASSFQVTLWPGELSNRRICRVIRRNRGGRVFAFQNPQAPHASVNPDTYFHKFHRGVNHCSAAGAKLQISINVKSLVPQRCT